MKARDLKKKLTECGWWNTGHGSKHEKWTNGTYSIAVPRHNEIPEGTARAILNEAKKYGRQEKRK
ncbi:MAG: type II toxin-antitoxin system HicA family toxin [Deltaproteobacteria bacterium]|nr:type II toxin-antitoxin system HicA family toxin [Deltaproteobacteria bacterium]